MPRRRRAALPPLLVAAERVAATVAQGVHGRRRVGTGETFWQFRQYQPGDPATRIDWRESAKSQRLYVRETEWEAAQSVCLWRDGSASMDYASSRALPDQARARRPADLGAGGAAGARRRARRACSAPGLPASHGRAVLDRMALLMARGDASGGLPAFEQLPRHGQIVLIGDLLAPLDEMHATGRALRRERPQRPSAAGARPREETLPFAGRVRFEGLEREAADPDQPGRDGASHLYRAAAAPSRRPRRDRPRRRLELRHPPHRPAAARRASRALRRDGAAAGLAMR